MDITKENIERGERLLKAEILKCEMSIENLKQELFELNNNKGLFKNTDKKTIAAVKEKMLKEKVYLIDLQAMNGAEFYEYIKSKENKNNIIYERLQKAEVQKCKMSIENLKHEILELKKPKGLFGSTDKKAIAAAEEKLKNLEVYLIDIQAMNGTEFYEYMKSKEKKDNIINVSSKVFKTAGKVVENVTEAIPGVSIAGKMIGKGFKTIGKSIKED